MVNIPLVPLPCTRAQVFRLLFYTPSATVVRLLTTNALIAYITNCVLYLSGASQDPRMLLPAWVSIATVRLTARLSQYPESKPTDNMTDFDNALPSHTS